MPSYKDEDLAKMSLDKVNPKIFDEKSGFYSREGLGFIDPGRRAYS